MARRSRSAEATLLVLAIVIGLPVYLVMKIINVTGWMLPVVVVSMIIGLFMASRANKRRRRIEALRRKYPEEIVQRILQGHIWQGQTKEQLIDAIGSPAEVDTKVLKSMHREIWKYGRISAKRFRLRVTVENGMVTGWDQKG